MGLALCTALLATVLPAGAACTRPLQAPLAEVGLTVNFVGGSIEGVLPRLFHELSTELHCELVLSQVPRARQQHLFEQGRSDLLAPASRTPERDAAGEFIPLVQVRAALLSLGRAGPPVERLADLVANPALRLVVVRGYDFGPAYRDAVAQLRKQGRLTEEASLVGVVRALREGLADLTLMAPTILVGTLAADPALAPLLNRLRVEPVPELAWNESGLYLSRHHMSPADRKELRQWFAQAVRSGRVWQVFTEVYPPRSLDGHMRPVE